MVRFVVDSLSEQRAADERQPASKNDAGVTPPQSPPIVTRVNNGVPTEPATHQQLTQTEQKIEERMSAFERSMIRLTRYGIIVGVITLLIFGGQLYEMREGGTQTDKIIAADERMAGAMETAAGEAKQSIDTTVDNFHLEQRAWVSAISVVNIHIEAGQKPFFQVMFSNSGKTPAIHAHIQVTGKARPAKESITFTYPPVTGIFSDTTIQPGTQTLVNAGQDNPIITGEQVSLLKNGITKLYIYGKVEYLDIFARRHMTTFCAAVTPDLKSYVWCDKGNAAE